jgi:hypothetical protein
VPWIGKLENADAALFAQNAHDFGQALLVVRQVPEAERRRDEIEAI